MCGIVGIYNRYEPVDTVLLSSMRDTMIHRGPDDAGIWLTADRSIGFAHRRLSIIDLSLEARQPMADISGQFVIVFNGEIYNFIELRKELTQKGHAFRTKSDTEVLIEAYRAWGKDCLNRLNGMFSFCIFDNEKKTLFFARDRAGEKPLFYYHVPGMLLFASELKALLAHPRLAHTLDLEGLEYYLMYGYIPGERSIIRNVRKLPAGHSMIYDVNTGLLTVSQYWCLPEPDLKVDSSVESLSSELETLLEDAVRHQLIADVPLGILLSGGVDSSIVTAIASRVSTRQINTFTISFPDHKGFDESPHARLVASHFGTDHSELAAEPATIDLLLDLSKQFDEPMADSSMLPTYLVSRLVRSRATVALGGDGGDELFGGYFHYSWIQRQEMARRLLPSVARHLIANLGKRLIPLGFPGRTYVIGLANGIMNSVAHVNVFFDDHVRRKLLSPIAEQISKKWSLPDAYRANIPVPGESAIQRAMATDFMTYLPDDILTKVDRASMLVSLEVRAPFLDYRIVEFAFSKVPDALRVKGVEKKILLRHLARRLLPPSLNINRKQGFAIPISQWLQGSWGPYFRDVLYALPPELFDRRFVTNLLQSQNRGYRNTQRLFALMVFELWRRHYRIALP